MLQNLDREHSGIALSILPQQQGSQQCGESHDEATPAAAQGMRSHAPNDLGFSLERRRSATVGYFWQDVAGVTHRPWELAESWPPPSRGCPVADGRTAEERCATPGRSAARLGLDSHSGGAVAVDGCEQANEPGRDLNQTWAGDHLARIPT